jgi:hypothetical protein
VGPLPSSRAATRVVVDTQEARKNRFFVLETRLIVV